MVDDVFVKINKCVWKPFGGGVKAGKNNNSRKFYNL